MSKVVEIDGLLKEYGELTAVNRINLEIEEGEV
ncbi:MAG: ABC transporter ATP-binding protein, partial [Clostridiales bacterium]|nr:ABC transporter ATP-binding protein [Clostridiales bacterium]